MDDDDCDADNCLFGIPGDGLYASACSSVKWRFVTSCRSAETVRKTKRHCHGRMQQLLDRTFDFSDKSQKGSLNFSCKRNQK